MQLHWIAPGIIVLYLIATIFVGFRVSKRASQSVKHYFPGGNKLPWYTPGVSNASGMFDIAGTMWLAGICVAAAHVLKGVWPLCHVFQ
jgi:Na+/proline symporter